MNTKNLRLGVALLLILFVVWPLRQSTPKDTRVPLPSPLHQPATTFAVLRQTRQRLSVAEENAALATLLNRVVQCIAERSDYDAAIAAIHECTPEAERPDREYAVAEALARVNPNWATTFTFFLPSESARNKAASLVADLMVTRGVQEALEWAECLPVSFARSIAVDRIVSDVAQNDPAGTLETIEALPGSLVRDDALCSLATLWATQDRTHALRWASSIADGALRLRIYASIGFAVSNLRPSDISRLAHGIDSASDRSVFLSSVQYCLGTAAK